MFYLVIKVHMLLPTGVAESLIKTLGGGSEATKPFNILHTDTKDIMRTGWTNLIGVKGLAQHKLQEALWKVNPRS